MVYFIFHIFKYFKLIGNNSKLELGYNYQENKRKEFDLRRGGRTRLSKTEKCAVLNGASNMFVSICQIPN